MGLKKGWFFNSNTPHPKIIGDRPRFLDVSFVVVTGLFFRTGQATGSSLDVRYGQCNTLQQTACNNRGQTTF
jgi:hypothetical protein